ncbi:MAG: 6,7-dimethyl-8-ribityllumazine synthase [Planctomycetota bacterium]|nr:6,7-dimethyl-8-ribityllumazine synthase [Planctomycetota bacterium]
MGKVFEGRMQIAKGARFAVVVSRFNSLVTGQLLSGCLDFLRRHGASDDGVDVAWCPGAFEMPLVARKLAKSGRYSAIVCLGAVVRGGTPHFEYVAAEASKGIAAVMLETGVPVAFGVLTCDTLEQALERAGAKAGNKGAEAAASAVEMASLMESL